MKWDRITCFFAPLNRTWPAKCKITHSSWCFRWFKTMFFVFFRIVSAQFQLAAAWFQWSFPFSLVKLPVTNPGWKMFKWSLFRFEDCCQMATCCLSSSKVQRQIWEGKVNGNLEKPYVASLAPAASSADCLPFESPGDVPQYEALTMGEMDLILLMARSIYLQHTRY